MFKKTLNKPKQLKNQKAFTFVEVLVATLIVAMVMTALGSMMALSGRVAEANEMEQLAQLKAQQVIEFFRRERLVRGWEVFDSKLGDGNIFCVNDLPPEINALPSPGTCSTPKTDFNFFYYNIEATIDQNAADEINVQVNIYRYDKGGNEINPGVAFYTVTQTFKKY